MGFHPVAVVEQCHALMLKIAKCMHEGPLFCSPILFAISTSTFGKLCNKRIKRIQWHVEECSVALLCN
jgi:hypothetical protein